MAKPEKPDPKKGGRPLPKRPDVAENILSDDDDKAMDRAWDGIGDTYHESQGDKSE